MRLMASTHPANDYRLARWIAVSESFDWSRKLDHPAVDSKLRLAAIGDLLNTPTFKGMDIYGQFCSVEFV